MDVMRWGRGEEGNGGGCIDSWDRGSCAGHTWEENKWFKDTWDGKT